MRGFIFVTAILLSLPGWAEDEDEIKNCLRSWGQTPFAKSNPEFRTLNGQVKVMGIGKAVTDERESTKPELILVKPTVNVMSKSIIRLLNPNGWYCLKGKVAVLGKTEVELHCKAHMAMSDGGTTILGSDDSDSGVTVLGKSVVKRVGCQ